MSDRYFQCRLRRSDAIQHDKPGDWAWEAFTEQVAWIEERGAKIGAKVELVGDGFWTVVAVYHHMTGEALRDKQKNDRGSLPSIVGN